MIASFISEVLTSSVLLRIPDVRKPDQEDRRYCAMFRRYRCHLETEAMELAGSFSTVRDSTLLAAMMTGFPVFLSNIAEFLV